jgi:hypothetical protein
MDMRGIDGIGNWILVIMAATSCISMIAALSLNSIISQELPSYGLRFNYSWAIPYWNTIATIFAMSWVSIIAAITFQIYRIRTIRKDEAEAAREQIVMQETEDEIQTIRYDTANWEELEPERP